MYVYKITNKITGDFYIGKTVRTLEQRMKAHMSKHKMGDTYLYRAMKKYGFSNFSIECVQKYEDEDMLNEGEILYIKKLSPEYNMTSGGDGGNTSKSEKYQDYMKFRSLLISGELNPFYGKKHSEETKRKISEKNSGRIMTQEQKDKISKANLGKKMSPESIKKTVEKKSKVWHLIDPNGNCITVKNLNEYCRKNGLDQRNMTKMYNGLQKTSKGYTRNFDL
jgi:group I intron endonuclease